MCCEHITVCCHKTESVDVLDHVRVYIEIHQGNVDKENMANKHG